MKQRVFGITGWKNSGKTTLTERLVAELIARGYAVSTVKHAHHGFDLDREGSDSFRHRAAGAGEVAIVSGHRWALMHELGDEKEPSLEDIIARMARCDLILVEGYKQDPHPKIEVRRRDTGDRPPLAGAFAGIVAIAADHVVEGTELPVFGLDDIAAIADFVEEIAGLR